MVGQMESRAGAVVNNMGSRKAWRNIVQTLIDNGKLANQIARLQAIVVKCLFDFSSLWTAPFLDYPERNSNLFLLLNFFFF